MAGILTKGITLSYKKDGSNYSVIANLQECPELGGTAENVEVTTLADGNKKYIKGIKDFGELAFKFLYDKTQFAALQALDGSIGWQVELPDDSTCTFTGTASIKLDGVGVNAALTYTLSIKPDSEMTWA